MLASGLLAIALTAPGGVQNLAGDGTKGHAGDGGPAAKARLNQPFDVAYDAAGNLYFSDTGNHAIRKVDAVSGKISAVAGSGRKGDSGEGGPATAAELDEPYGIVLDRSGNLYFADRLNRKVKRVDAGSGAISTVAGTGKAESGGDGGPAAEAGLVEPNGVALDREQRRLFIADVAGCRVRVVDLGTGVIGTFAGTGRRKHEGDGGPAAAASVFGARAVAVAPDGAVLILEREGNTLRRVDPATGEIATIAGTGKKGYSGDGGPAASATFNGPKELDVAPDGAIAIVDTENNAIRVIDPKAGTIRTVAGDGEAGPGDRLDRPHGVAFAPGGRLVIGDTNNHRIGAAALAAP